MSENAFCRAAALTRRQLLPNWLLLLGLTLGLLGCSTSHRGSSGGDHPGHGKAASLELNEGKKWVVAKPMMVHIRNLETAVQVFDRTSGHDHASLAAQIQDDLGRLVTNCTMEGKAHDELHKWLMPFLALSTDYVKATDPQVQQHKLQEIKQALRVFHEYFE